MFKVIPRSFGICMIFVNLNLENGQKDWKRASVGMHIVYAVCFLQWGVQHHSGIIRCICGFWQHCVLKMARHRVKRIHFWASRASSVYRVLLPVKCSRSFCGHSVHFRFTTTIYLENGWSDFRQACNSKLADCRVKRTNMWASSVRV